MAGKERMDGGNDITAYLYSLNASGAKLGLERIVKLLDALDRPQDSFRSVIVGGTSGKGSTTAMIASVLTEAGYKTGRYTSPHLSSLTERIVIDGKEISEADFARMVGRVREKIETMMETECGRVGVGAKTERGDPGGETEAKRGNGIGVGARIERGRMGGEAEAERGSGIGVGAIGGAGREVDGVLSGVVFDHPSFFEVVTAAAFCYFREKRVEFAVLEVGLGGRLDATNTTSDANTPVTVITNISLEHTKILGDTIAKIAYEKAGIIKRNGMLVTAASGRDAPGVFETVCNERNARILRVGKEITFAKRGTGMGGQAFDAELEFAGKAYTGLRIPLLGTHQLENAACAIGAIEALRSRGIAIDDEAVARGLEKIKWPGRMEAVQQKPLVILDGAKDAAAMARLKETISGDVKHHRLILVIGISSDKDIRGMVGEIARIADSVIITAHKVAGRAADPETIALEVRRHGMEPVIVPDVKDAVKKAISLAGENDLVLVTGSLFTVGEAREIWHGCKARWGRELSETPKQ